MRTRYLTNRVTLGGLLSLLWLLLPPTASAQPAPPGVSSSSAGTISGVVIDSVGTPIADATVSAQKSGVHAITHSGANGRFSVDNLPAGTYVVEGAKEGYASVIVTDVPVLSGSVSNVVLVLVAPSLTSIKTIGQVYATTKGSKHFNSGVASIQTISSSDIVQQGQLNVERVLDQTPGIVTTRTASDPAVASAFTRPSIRGGLSYETAQLIDGHPVTTGTAGFFINNNLSSYALDDIELVKGPGATAPLVNYAINGSVNYKTKSPTRTPTASMDYGIDSQAGQFINLLASGPVSTRLGYLMSYYSFGSDGPFHNQLTNNFELFPGDLINGQVLAQGPYTFTMPPGTQNSFALKSTSAFIGNYPISGSTLIRSEVLKLRYDLSQESKLTVGVLGSQEIGLIQSTFGTAFDNVQFTPGAGYTGSIPAGAMQLVAPATRDPGAPQFVKQPLYEFGFGTRAKNDTILARYYTTLEISTLNYQPSGFNPVIGTYPLYGTVSLCPTGTVLDPGGSGNCGPPGGPYTTLPVPTTFNGNNIRLTIPGSGPVDFSNVDRLGGASLEYDHPVGSNLYTLAFDQNAQASTKTQTFLGTTYDVIPAGSGQRFTTTMLRAMLNPSEKLQYVFANYFNTYHLDYVDTFGGLGFKHSDSSFDASRAGVSYHPTRDIAWRFAIGQSIAPPFLDLLSNTATPPVFIPVPFPQYQETASNGLLKPETAFGIDLGQDVRFSHDASVFFWDLYRTDLTDQFLTSTTQQGTFDDGVNGPAPLYVTRNGNLGKARYEGIELGVERDPEVGFGYVVQGALIRAYPYDLPEGFYDLPGMPLTTNLGILPGINYTSAGVDGFSIPYSQGYIEANYRSGRGITAALGATYYGSNNSFDVPAFFVWSANAHVPLGEHTSLQISVDNLFDIYGGKYSIVNGGVPAPLVNGQEQLSFLNPQGPPIVRVIVHRDFGR